jgi:hypothetical protein
MDHANQTASIEQVSQDYLEPICELLTSGLSPEDISLALKIDIETVHQIIASEPMHRPRMVQHLKTQDLHAPQLHEDTLPTFIYSYKYNTDQLHRTNLVTGEHSSHRVPSYTFELGCSWSEVPGGSILITGGGYPDVVREVVRIDTRREFAVAHCPPMLTPRTGHAAVYHTPHLYILGGLNECFLSECERFVRAETDGKLYFLSLELAITLVE